MMWRIFMIFWKWLTAAAPKQKPVSLVLRSYSGTPPDWPDHMRLQTIALSYPGIGRQARHQRGDAAVDAEDVRPAGDGKRHMPEARTHVVLDSSGPRAVKLGDLRLEAVCCVHLRKLMGAAQYCNMFRQLRNQRNHFY
jgi:hypothetical protein